MKWIGQHIVDFIAKFRSDVYLEEIANPGSDTDKFLVADATTGKVGFRTGANVLADIGASSESSDLEFNGSTANGVLTYGGAAQIDVESSITYNPSLGGLQMFGATGAGAFFGISQSTDDNNGAVIRLGSHRAGADAQDDDKCGVIEFQGKDDGTPSGQMYGSFTTYVADATSDQEAGRIELKVAEYDGTLTTGLTLDGDTDANGEVDVTIGAGAASVTTVAGTLTMGSTAAMTNAGLLSVAGQTNITSLGTLTALDVDNININGDTITASGDLAIVASGNDITVATDSLTVTSTGTLAPLVNLKSTANNEHPGFLAFTKDRGATPADNDAIGSILFQGEDSGQSVASYGTIESTIIETDHGDEAGQIAITVANDGVLRNGITVKGDKGTATEVDVDIANGAASTTTIAGTLTMGSTATINNSGVWVGGVIPSAKLDTDTAHLSGSQSFTGPKSFTGGARIDTRQIVVSGGAGGSHSGDVVYMGGTTSMAVGQIYHYNSGGAWELADANAVATSDGLLAVALGAASDTNGMLLRGMVTLDHDPGSRGDVLYLSVATTGLASATVPTGNNDIVRVIGYQVNADTGNKIWFNPDNTFVEVTA